MIYAGGEVTAEADSAGTLKLSYVWGLGADDLVAIHDDSTGSHYYVTQDELGSVRGISKRDGTWQGTFRYRPYGAALDSAERFRSDFATVGSDESSTKIRALLCASALLRPDQSAVHARRPKRIRRRLQPLRLRQWEPHKWRDLDGTDDDDSHA